MRLKRIVWKTFGTAPDFPEWLERHRLKSRIEADGGSTEVTYRRGGTRRSEVDNLVPSRPNHPRDMVKAQHRIRIRGQRFRALKAREERG